METKIVKNPNLKIFLIVSVICGYEFLSFFPDMLGFENRIISVAFRLLVGLVCLLLIFRNKLRINKDVNIVFLFLFLYVLRFLYETAFNNYYIKLPLLDYWGYLVLGCLLPMFALLTDIDGKVLQKSFMIIFGMLIFINVLGLINNQQYILDGFSEERVRADANSGMNTITFASMAMYLIVFCLILLEKTKYKLLLLPLIILAIINVGIAGSRGPLLQAIIVSLLFFYKKREKLKLKYIITGLIMMPFIIYYLDNKYNAFELLTARFTKSQTEEGGSDYGRLQYLQGAWEQFLNSPFIGDSIEVKPYGIYPHNMVLESLMVLGIFGGIFIAIILIKSLRKSISLFKYEEVTWVVILFLFNYIATFTAGSIVNNFKFWTLLAIILTYKSKTDTALNESSHSY